jgi:hypothetical protein
MLVAWLGWRTCEGIRFTTGEYSVRLGSAPQHDPRRAEAHRLFVAEAVGQASKSPWVAEEMQPLAGTLSRLWQATMWQNDHEEAYWRLTVNGIPLLGNSHMQRAGMARCGCGMRPGHGESRDTPRILACPVAQAVVGQVEHKLGMTITRANLWLAQVPGQTEQCVSDVMVMTAIATMETGRRFMAATLRRGGATRESLDLWQEWSWRREARDGP